MPSVPLPKMKARKDALARCTAGDIEFDLSLLPRSIGESGTEVGSSRKRPAEIEQERVRETRKKSRPTDYYLQRSYPPTPPSPLLAHNALAPTSAEHSSPSSSPSELRLLDQPPQGGRPSLKLIIPTLSNMSNPGLSSSVLSASSTLSSDHQWPITPIEDDLPPRQCKGINPSKLKPLNASAS